MNAHARDFAPIDDQTGTQLAAGNIDAECALIGALLLHNEALAACPFLEPAHFSEPLHGRIFSTMRDLVERGRRADPVTILEYLKDEPDVAEGFTVRQYVARMMAEAVPASGARDYAIAILDSYASRYGATLCGEFQARFLSRGPSEGILSIIGEMEDEIGTLRGLAPGADMRGDIESYALAFMERISERRTAPEGVPMPFAEMSRVLQTDVFEYGNLYGLLASSGEGKTSMTLQIVDAAASAGHPVLFLSYDQTGEQILRQMASQRSGVSYAQMMQKGGMARRDEQLVIEAADDIRRLPIHPRRCTNEKIGRICGYAQAFAKRWRTRVQRDGTPYKGPLIVLDHNRKVTPDDSRAHEGRIAASINGAGKALAEEIGAAVIFLNQRNSGGSKRDVPRPIALDLFGGEQAREDYDAILYLYRPEKWRDEKLKICASASEEDKIRARFRINGEEPENLAEIGALKVRYGDQSVREVLEWEGRYTRYRSRTRAQGGFL